MIELKLKYLSGADKIVGLLTAKKAYPVFFKTRFGVHTFGLKFPVDVLILDKNNVVKKLKKNLMPNRIFLWNPHFEKVIELRAGDIKKWKIKLGDELKIQIN